MNDQPITARDVVRRLQDRYLVADGWITMAEVTPPKAHRRFDLIAIMGWQSRGHEAMGFEVKVSRSDWLAELKDPAKAEPLVRLCSRWWIAAPPGVVRVEELPPAWGLLVLHPDQIRTGKQAPQLNPEPWPDEVWRCMLLRLGTREARTPEDLERAKAEGRKEAEKWAESNQKRSVAHLEAEVRGLRTQIQQARDATGVDLDRWTDFPALGEAMRLLSARDSTLVDVMERDSRKLRDAAIRLRLAARAIRAGAHRKVS